MAAIKEAVRGLALARQVLVLVAVSFVLASSARAQISLGTAQSFGVLAGSAITNTGSTIVAGNLGVSPGTAVTGFPPGVVTPPGVIHSADAVASTAQSDLTTAFNAVAATPTFVDLTGTDLGGLTLQPGVYGFSSVAQLTGTLTLDALGNPNALFIFKVGSALTTATGASVSVINGGSSCNVYWQVGSSATLGTTTAFVGNILALSSIVMNTGVSLNGRALARTGAVTLANNTIAACPTSPPGVCPTVTLSPTLASGTVGAAYSQGIAPSGGVGPYTFAVAGGALPPGLALNGTTGVISGSPGAAGTYNVLITATDSNGCPGSRAYVITIAGPACSAITLSPSTVPVGHIGSGYVAPLTAAGGTGPYTYAITAGAIPAGLALNPTTGAISGMPTTAGPFAFTVSATDANGCMGSRSYSLIVSAVACPTLSLTPVTLPGGALSTAYAQVVAAAGGSTPYSYAITAGSLPPGLALNGATGAIAGMLSAPGSFAFTVTATDANGCMVSRAYTLAVSGTTVPVSISPPTLPGGTVGIVYVQTITASGGTAPYTYAVTSGALPSGLTLGANGQFLGSPTLPGTFTFTVTVTDAVGSTASMTYTVTVVASGSTGGPGASIPTLSEWGLVILVALVGLTSVWLRRRSG